MTTDALTAVDDRTRRGSFAQVWKLACLLCWRDLTGRYRRHFMGAFASLLQPSLLMVAFAFLGSMMRMPTDGLPYPIFMLCGYVPFSIVSSAVQKCTGSISSNAAVLRKVYVPPGVFPIIAVIQSLVDNSFLLALLAIIVLSDHMLLASSVAWLILLVGINLMLCLGVAMVQAAMGLIARDFLSAGQFLMQLWLYLSPVIYPARLVSDQWKWLYNLNPMVGLLENYRLVLGKNLVPDFSLLAPCAGISCILFVVGCVSYMNVSRYLADEL